MPLSEYEQRVLEQMERQLTSDDPRLASTLQSRGRRGIGRWVIAGAGLLVGLLLLVAGAAGSQLWVGVIGFVLMLASAVFAFAAPRPSGPTGIVDAKGGVGPRPTSNRPTGNRPTGKARKQRGGFLQRFEDRWDRRREDRGH
ncbi:DUF3040 domain-containing protein [Cellulomonas fimi]|uniref:DUF3040 domain-containing protein n=1 Tax=Cellulomonas fimi TaxID=1708 RepID=A0A7Y0LYV0_CELFI|nr:DUF3040 domain-containing protein [Cellulomonas fimi]NMR20620.1 DUF3040 domain-containing protein [Cellulomonas fimi]